MNDPDYTAKLQTRWGIAADALSLRPQVYLWDSLVEKYTQVASSFSALCR